VPNFLALSRDRISSLWTTLPTVSVADTMTPLSVSVADTEQEGYLFKNNRAPAPANCGAIWGQNAGLRPRHKVSPNSRLYKEKR
jgi:hypothetical protein